MNKMILVPTDFSKNANNAFDYAVELAKKEKAKIILLHAYTVPSLDVSLLYRGEQTAVMEQYAAKQLKALCRKAESKQVLCELLNKQGSAVDLILETIKKMKPDLAVMGTKGANGIKEMVIGSNTAKVIEKAKCPVIAVPEKALFSPIKHITYATDYHTSDIAALKKLIEIGKLFDSRITLLHASDEEFTRDSEEEYMNKFKGKIKSQTSYGKMVFKLVYGNYLVKVLEDYITRESPDLFAMSTQHHNIFDRLFGTSSTEKMAYHTKVPLIAFHCRQNVSTLV